MNFGHGHKFADACKQVRNRTHAPSSGLNDDAAALLLQKMNAIEQAGRARDRAIADVTQGLHHIDKGVHHIDETTTKTAQSVAQIKAYYKQKQKQYKIEEQIALGLEQHKEWEPVGTQKKPAAQTKPQAKPTSAKNKQSLQKIQKMPATAS